MEINLSVHDALEIIKNSSLKDDKMWNIFVNEKNKILKKKQRSWKRVVL